MPDLLPLVAETTNEVTITVTQFLGAMGALGAVIVYQEARIRSLTDRLIGVIQKFASDGEDRP